MILPGNFLASSPNRTYQPDISDVLQGSFAMYLSSCLEASQLSANDLRGTRLHRLTGCHLTPSQHVSNTVSTHMRRRVWRIITTPVVRASAGSCQLSGLDGCPGQLKHVMNHEFITRQRCQAQMSQINVSHHLDSGACIKHCCSDMAIPTPRRKNSMIMIER